MAEHNVGLELYYNGRWNPAPALHRGVIRYMRGSKTPGNDTEPATGSALIDNGSGDYAPRSATSALRGLIGQNTPGRITVGGNARMTGEVASWKPGRPVKGSGWTEIQLAGVLQRIGRGTDPVLPALTRAAIASGPVDYWPLDDGQAASSGANAIAGGQAMTSIEGTDPPTWSGVDDTIVPDGMAAMVATPGAGLTAAVRGTSTISWRMEAVYAIDGVIAPGLDVIRGVVWTTGGGINTWWVEHGETATIVWAYSYYSPGLLFGGVVLGSGDARFQDGLPHHIAVDVQQTTSVDMTYQIYLDGELRTFGTNSTGTTVGRPQVGAPTIVQVNPDGDARLVAAGGVGFWSPSPVTALDFAAVGGYDGESAADRFLRLCDEEDLDATLRHNSLDSIVMGPQRTVTLLELFDEVARTDDAWIFETANALGLTMATGLGKLNQEPEMTLNYLGQLRPPVTPVLGDEGIRNDVTAKNPDGSSRQVIQETGPHNVQLPQDDDQGVGRYRTSIDVNVQDDDALLDQAGWRVNLGTYDGTWYAEVTVDVDAAGTISGLSIADIGDVIRIINLPEDEATDAIEGVIIGIGEELPPKRRFVTYFLVPNDTYRVGLLAETSGDTDPFVGSLDPDGSVTTAAVAVGAASFTVSTASGPLWTRSSVTADDFPMDVVVGGQRVSISAISGATSPQTFTVRTAGYQVRYPIAAGETVLPYQPIILTM